MFDRESRYTTKYYYTLEECLKAIDAWNNDVYTLALPTADEFINVAVKALSITDDQKLGQSIVNKPEVNKLWSGYVVPRWRSYGVVVADKALSNVELTSAFGDWLSRHFLSIAQATGDKYIKLINLYAEKEAALMDAIKQTSISKFNDTPQDSGDYSTDPYVSNLTKATSEVDGATVMSRLAEVRDEWDNVYREWVREFHNIFIPLGGEYDR